MGDLAAGVAKLTTEVAALTKKVAYLEQAPKVSRVQKCHKYARFLKNASAGEANAIFWSLVAFGIVLLMIASLLWSSQDKHHRNFENAIKNQETQQNLQALEAKKTKSHERVVLASILCFLTAVPCIIIEAFAGMAITFCHKEDVPFLYWGVFFLLSVGSLIAVMGLSFGIMCSSRRPPWNLSLGTPVLVIAGLGHLGFYGMRDQVRKLQGKEPKHNSREPPSDTLPITRAISDSRSLGSASVEVTMRESPFHHILKHNASVPMTARFIGTTPDGRKGYLELVPSDPHQMAAALSSTSTVASEMSRANRA